ncbi:hypothetical protein M378DRAFT_434388 [Amanita muscaria Koide BX008]|uniref:Uncharacterized protein n=1 Tax=Amanita muscaria (strain Koide BX008) TaxID=946122 RepID=A0A0C2S2N6_AMAMK|nr:hypothetical protein M378DRAFT_434388 [Amanita muscaria Koide BX008]
MLKSTTEMFGITRKAQSKYKPHPIFGTIQPILEFFSPTKRSKSPDHSEPETLVQQDSIILPESFPHGPNPRTQHNSGASDVKPGPSTTPSSSRSDNERRKKRIERTKHRMAYPPPRRTTSNPKSASRSQKSRSVEHLHKDVSETLAPMTDSMNEEDRIFLEQMDKMVWAHKYRTGLVECRDTAERASASVSGDIQDRDERLAHLIEEEKVVRVKLERQASEERGREEARKLEQEQRRADIKKATQAVVEKVKQGEIRRERTRELIRVVNKSELDIMASTQTANNADQEHIRVELEKLAEAKRQLRQEQEACRQQFEEIAHARAELEAAEQRMREAEEAARTQASERASQLDEMAQNCLHLQQEIDQLQSDKEAAERKSDDVLFQARFKARRLREEHERVLRETEEANARTVAETTMNFQAVLQQETEARQWAEARAVEATMAAAQAEAEARMLAGQAPFHDDVQFHDVQFPDDVQFHDDFQFHGEAQFHGGWQAPPEFDMQPASPLLPPPPPPMVVLTDADRIVLYERKWEALKSMTETIFFNQMPWPVLIDIVHPDQLNIDEMRRFVSHEVYRNLASFQGKSIRDRMKMEMLRWHPDKFARVLPMIDPSHQDAVKEAAERVAKLFTQLMSEA